MPPEREYEAIIASQTTADATAVASTTAELVHAYCGTPVSIDVIDATVHGTDDEPRHVVVYFTTERELTDEYHPTRLIDACSEATKLGAA